MQVGDRIHLYINTNLRTSFRTQPNISWEERCLKDPKKGIVLKKFEGFVLKVLEEGSRLDKREIEKYCQGRSELEESFRFNNRYRGIRVIVEFPKLLSGKFRLLSKDNFCDEKTRYDGYARHIPNSMQFIREDL